MAAAFRLEQAARILERTPAALEDLPGPLIRRTTVAQAEAGPAETPGGRMPGAVVELLASLIQPSPGHRSWHGGPTPIGALRGVTAAQAAWRPAPGRHSIWALTLHLAYWKYAVRRVLEQRPRGGFPRRPANWPGPPEEADPAQWARDVALLHEEHERLVAAALRLSPERLGRRPPDKRSWTYGELITGIALHDAYHTGQIQMLKRLWQARARARGPRG